MEKIFLLLHGISLLFILFTLALAYREGYEWWKGRKETLDARRVTRLHHRAWLGIVLMLATGFGTFWSHHAEFMAKWQFHAKMGTIVVVIINCLVITKLMSTASKQSFKNLSSSQRLPIIISATIATIGWATILLMAGFIGIDE